MAITEETVDQVARLARLRLDPIERQRLTHDLSRILDLAEQLRQLPTEDIPAMSHAVEIAMPEREDRVTLTNQRDRILASAPEQEEGCFRVPKVIE